MQLMFPICTVFVSLIIFPVALDLSVTGESGLVSVKMSSAIPGVTFAGAADGDGDGVCVCVTSRPDETFGGDGPDDTFAGASPDETSAAEGDGVGVTSAAVVWN